MAKAKTHTIKLTQQGIDNLKQELNELKEDKRPKLVARLSNARDQGDLSENSDYIAAREELQFMDDRIAELEEVVASAQIAPTSSTDTVGIGNTVTIQVQGKTQKVEFHIVGDWEADPKEKKISEQSPIGKALHGKKVGDIAEVQAPAGVIKYEILKIV